MSKFYDDKKSEPSSSGEENTEESDDSKELGDNGKDESSDEDEEFSDDDLKKTGASALDLPSRKQIFATVVPKGVPDRAKHKKPRLDLSLKDVEKETKVLIPGPMTDKNSRLPMTATGLYLIYKFRKEMPLTNFKTLALARFWFVFNIITFLYVFVVNMMWYAVSVYTPNTMFYVYYPGFMMLGAYFANLYRCNFQLIYMECFMAFISGILSIWMFANQFSGAYDAIVSNSVFNNYYRFNGTSYFSTFTNNALVISTYSVDNPTNPPQVWYWLQVGSSALMFLCSMVHFGISLNSLIKGGIKKKSKGFKNMGRPIPFSKSGEAYTCPLTNTLEADKIRLVSTMLAAFLALIGVVLGVISIALYSLGIIIPEYLNSADMMLFFVVPFCIFPPPPSPPNDYIKDEREFNNFHTIYKIKFDHDSYNANYKGKNKLYEYNPDLINEDNFGIRKRWWLRFRSTSGFANEMIMRSFGKVSWLYWFTLGLEFIAFGISVGTLIGLSEWRTTQDLPQICVNVTEFYGLVTTSYYTSKEYTYFDDAVRVVYWYNSTVGGVFAESAFASFTCLNDWMRILCCVILGLIFMIQLGNGIHYYMFYKNLLGSVAEIIAKREAVKKISKIVKEKIHTAY